MNDTEATINRRIGQLLRQARRVRGLTQADMGRDIGVSFQQIQKYESGENVVSPGKLVVLAKVLGLTTQHFFDTIGHADADLETHQKVLRLARRIHRLEEDQPAVFRAIYQVVAALTKDE